MLNTFNIFYTKITEPKSTQPDDMRLERLTRIILFFATIVIALGATAMTLAQSLMHNILPNMLYGTILASAVLFGAWAITIYGQWRIARYVPIALSFTVTLYLVLIYPIGAVAALYSVATILFSFTLLGRYKAWAVSILVLILPTIIEWMALKRYYVRPPYEASPSWYFAITIEFIMTIIGITVLLEIFSTQFKESLTKTENYAAELEAHKQSLEITVAERTAALQNSLAEKEVLLREIHHRVKNNLQIVSGLLYLQARQSASPEVRAPLEESHTRVKSMAMVHEMLYQSPDLGQINFSDYARQLTNFIAQTYRNPHIRVNFDVPATILPIDTAITCGLILNELVTNVYKYAFPDHTSGTMTVSITRDDTGKSHLIVADTGCGFSDAQKTAIKNDGLQNFNHQNSLGIQLITQLTRQLQGIVTLSHEGGTTFEIVF